MKLKQKLGILLVLVLGFLGWSFVSPHRAAAAVLPDDIANCAKNVTFVSIAEIDCTFTAKDTGQSVTVHFIDQQPDDTDQNNGDGSLHHLNYKADSYFEQDTSCPDTTPSGGTGKYGPGITITDIDGKSVIQNDNTARHLLASDAGSTINLRFRMGYMVTQSGTNSTKCQHYDSSTPGFPSVFNAKPDSTFEYIVSGDQTQGVANYLIGSSAGISSFDYVTKGVLSGKTYATSDFKDGSTSFYTSGYTKGQCSGEVITYSDGKASRFVLKNGSLKQSDFPELFAFMQNQGLTNCGQDDFQRNFFSQVGNIIQSPFSVVGTPGTDCSGQTGCNPASGGSTDNGGKSDGCTSAGGTLAWLECPIINAMNDIVNGVYSLFTSTLSFRVCAQIPPPQNTNLSECKTAKGNDKLHLVWTIIKDIATALLVIVMLVMVISQAVGSGPFDAYSVKKLLPRMVAVAILMQVSWQLFAYIINLFDDAGRGLGALLYLPFGGEKGVDLANLLHTAGFGTAGIDFSSAILLIFGGLFINGAMATVLIFLVGAVLSLFTGLATLVFRKILIIMLLVTSPLALIFWIMPNQTMQSYFKKWEDNFLKALAMYPLVIALIASGKIFAYITGASESSVIPFSGLAGGATGKFLSFIFIMIGFFAPLAILPKTFKWGGAALSAASNAIEKWENKANERMREPIKGFAESWWTGRKADSYDPTKSAFSASVGRKNLFGRFGGPKIRPSVELNGRAWRRLQSGHFLPTKRSRNLTLKRGEEWSTARTQEALSYEQKVSRTHQARGVTADEAKRWNESAAKDFGYDRGKQARDPNTGKLLTDSKGNKIYENDIFKEMQPGVGAGKWSALALFWNARKKGDSALQKAVADHLIDSKSGLEYRNRMFIAPMKDDHGKNIFVPMFGHEMTIDRAYKDPNRYATLASMGGDFPPHNTPFGGKGGMSATGYANVYIRGVKYIKNPATGKAELNPDFNPDVQQEFGVDVGQDEASALTQPQYLDMFKQGKHFKPMAWAAHYAQASYDDARNNMSMGGSMGGAFMNMLSDGATRGFVPGEGANPMPARQAVWVMVNSTRTQQGRDDLKVLYTDPTTKELAQKMIDASGVTHFRDIYGAEHKLTVDNLWRVNTAAEEKMKREDLVPGVGNVKPAPGQIDSLLTSDRSGQIVPLQGHEDHAMPRDNWTQAPAASAPTPAAPQSTPAAGAAPAGGTQPVGATAQPSGPVRRSSDPGDANFVNLRTAQTGTTVQVELNPEQLANALAPHFSAMGRQIGERVERGIANAAVHGRGTGTTGGGGNDDAPPRPGWTRGPDGSWRPPGA